MKILAVESSGLVASAAIIEDSVMTAEYTVNHKKTHSQTLLPMIAEICRMTELDLSSVDAIAVSKGPGSFTGLRIGSATVKGLAFALNKPVIPVPTVDALAMNAWGYEGIVCPVMDARRDQVYTGIYAFNEKYGFIEEYGELKVIMPQCPLGIDELIKKLTLTGCDQKILFLGDGVPVYEEAIRSRLDQPFQIAPPFMQRQRAAALGALAAIYYKMGRYETGKEHRPEYLRLSQAERELKESSQKDTGKSLFDNNKEDLIVIRRMTENDADQVSGIEEETFSMPWRKKDFLEMIERDNMSYLVIEKDGVIIGGAGIREIAGDIEITNVVVKEGFRGRGYGKRLLRSVLNEGRRLGGRQFTLEVRKSNVSAIKLYEGAGFKVEGERKDFYEKPRENALIFWKRE
ncbi:MAG: tRNA (adenosine(37)-N6)-threonylcarbamoyltransferase complex dimerization subunit type 1 TsaB [Lachnospiraceae bacterium]|nr:tRNA (adenosine(37)-N6)-threonylcarbamoyltransferase complex dimerization subunit type 1 TsaB [Lachnospiraceae bacterium]